MAVKTVKLADLGSYVVGLTSDRYHAVVKATQTQCATLGLVLIQEEVDRAKAVDRATYRRAWKCFRLTDGARLSNSTIQSAILEGGRRAGARQPPVGDDATQGIWGWVHRHSLADNVRGRKNRAKAERGIAFVIARAIAKRGQKARWILRDAMKRFRLPLKEAVHVAASGEGK
jgi:hypothetical protein